MVADIKLGLSAHARLDLESHVQHLSPGGGGDGGVTGVDLVESVVVVVEVLLLVSVVVLEVSK